jgi:glycosyltransferase involved in cell wall biosynthesis
LEPKFQKNVHVLSDDGLDIMNDHLIILSESASFPWGMAAANRVRNLAKGAMMEGWHVTYVGLRGADIKKKEKRKYRVFGKEEGILYCYPGLFAVRPGNWWVRRLDDFLGWLLTVLYILKKKMFREVDAITFYSRNGNVTGFWIPFLHLLRIPVILEVCEWPLAIAETHGTGQKKAEQFCAAIVPKSDAVLPISTYIENEIKKVAALNRRIIPSYQIPILIDVENEFPGKADNTDRDFMLYCGSIAYMDIAMILVDIVYELKNRGIELPVKFTGKEDYVHLVEFKKYAEQRGVFGSFDFTGFIEEKELHGLMRQAICLLAPLPDNPQSESRFSTKIGYYLASATPVITNSIGDVNLYLKDEVNAFVAPKCDIIQFVKKIERIMEDPALAKHVGITGRDLALEKFHYTRACKGFGRFLRNVVEGYRNHPVA